MPLNSRRHRRFRTRNPSSGEVKQLVVFGAGAVLGACLWSWLRNKEAPRAPKHSAGLERPSKSVSSPILQLPSALPQAESMSDRPAHERSDISLAAVTFFLVLLVLGAFVIHTVLWGWLKSMETPSHLGQLAEWSPLSGAAAEFPPLQVSPQADLQNYIREQQALLNAALSSDSSPPRLSIDEATRGVAMSGTVRWPAAEDVMKLQSPLQLQQRRPDQRNQ